MSRSLYLCANPDCRDPATEDFTILAQRRPSGEVLWLVPVRWQPWRRVHLVWCPVCGTVREFRDQEPKGERRAS
jgi:hypothetical protein